MHKGRRADGKCDVRALKGNEETVKGIVEALNNDEEALKCDLVR